MADQGYLHQRSDRFGKVPAEVMHDLALTDGAVRLYAHMHWRYGSNCDNHEGRSSMADYLGVSPTTISHRVAELVRADWVVVVPNYNDEGRTTNIYHVFELQSDCRQWRVDNECPKPEAKPKKTRKTRQGKGGKPAHKVSKKTQVHAPIVSEPEFTTLVNLSSHDPDPIDPDPYLGALPQVASIELDPGSYYVAKDNEVTGPFKSLTSASAYGATNGGSTIQGTRQNAQHILILHPPPQKPKPRNPVYDAIAQLFVGVNPADAQADNDLDGLINALYGKVVKREKRYLNTERPLTEHWPRMGEEIHDLAWWYDRQCQNCPRPKDKTKFATWLNKWYDAGKPQKPKPIDDTNVKFIEHDSYVAPSEVR